MKWLGILLAVKLAAAIQAAVPVAVCATCHPKETAAHARTRMAHAMQPVSLSLFSKQVPVGQALYESDGGYSVQYEPQPDGTLRVQAFRGGDQAAGVIRWVLGAGAQGQTPLVEYRNEVLESRVSYFPQLHQYGITTGQTGGASKTAVEALGLKQNPSDLKSCISCHATAITSDSKPVVPGVQCQRCHPGAEDHVRGKGPPLNPGKLQALTEVQFCGTCHRTRPPIADGEPENVRFQPVRLMKSRCFTVGRIRCTTCHSAHEDVRRDDAGFYNGKCAGCHAPGEFHSSAADQRKGGDCIGCHMPRVQLHPALRFTDHYIQAAGQTNPSRAGHR